MRFSWLWYRLCGPLYRWWRWRTDFASRRVGSLGLDCPWCGEDVSDVWMDTAYFTHTRAGHDALPSEPTVYWAEGLQTCPRCRYRWRVCDTTEQTPAGMEAAPRAAVAGTMSVTARKERMAYNGIPSQAQSYVIYQSDTTAPPWIGGNVIPAVMPDPRHQGREDARQMAMLETWAREHTQELLPPRTCTMLDQLKAAKLDTTDIDHLLTLSALGKLLSAEYTDVGLEAPGWLPKRQRAIRHAITAALEAQMDKLDTEEKALREQEQKRQDIAAQREKLRRVLDKAPA